MAEIQIYDMATNATPNDDDFFEQDIVDLDLPAGRNNKKISLGAVSNFVAKTHNYTSDLQTTNKTIVGAINEVLNEGTSVSVTNVLPATETTKRVATITVDGVAKDVNADDADKILRAAFGEHTASGNPVSVDAFLGLEVPSECKVTMNPIQSGSGDPSPTNIRPISGRTQASVVRTPIDIATLYNGMIQENGAYTSNNARITNANKTQSNVYFLKKGTHTLSFKKLNGNAVDLVECSVLTKNANFVTVNNFASSWHSLPFTFTTTEDAYLYFTARKDYSTNLNPSDYKAFIDAETHTHQYGQTVYGGEDDFVNGELSNEWVVAEYDGDVSEAWGKASSATWDVFYVELADEATGLVADIRSDSTNISVYNFAQMVENAPCISIRTNLTPNRLHIAIPNVTTVEECKAYLAEHNLQVCYKKATPTTIQTSAEEITLLKGTNVLSTDGDSLELKYSADIKAYIDSKLA